jgi:hypothetical protein
MAILREDPDFAGALAKKKEAVKKDKQNLLQAAETYTQKYEEEIAEGTKLRQKLLTEGQSQGLSEEEIFRGSNKFIPTVYTPILNFLYFMFRDEARDEQARIRELTQQYIKEYGYENVMKVLEEGVDDSKDVTLEDILSNDTNTPDEMEKFVYGNLTNDEFKRIKKLKALSHSPNEKEAFLAYRKANEMCKKYGLEFEKIPCNLKKKS